MQPLARVCSVPCARRVGPLTRKAQKGDLRAAKARLDELRPLNYWRKQAQTAFNAWIRWRDRDEPCISCGTTDTPQWDAGHWLSRGAHPELAFDERQVRKQCSRCNDFLSGNQLAFRAGLVRLIGLEAVQEIEGPHEPKRYRKDDYIGIRDTYRARLRAEQKEAA